MPKLLLTTLLFILVTAAAGAQTVRIQGKEVPYRLVDGQQMIARSQLAELFPGFPDGEGSVDLSILIQNPNARILKRNGLIVSVRYYDNAMAAIYGPSKNQRVAPSSDSETKETSQNLPFRQLMDEIVRLSNMERKNHGVPVLETDSYLEQAATSHSQEMGKLGYFSHTSPVEGRETPQKRIQLTGCAARRMGENIAQFGAYPESVLAEKVVTGWMNSPGHRRNLLDPNYTHIGIGVGKTGGVYYLTQNFCAY